MRLKNLNISFEKVIGTDEQIELLYSHLKNRNFGISHKLLPLYKDHITFVKNHPYSYWAFVLENNFPVGTVYLQTNNSIGLNLQQPTRHLVSEALRHIQNNFEPEKEITSITVIVTLLASIPAQSGYTQTLPAPGQMVPPSGLFQPAMMLGLRVNVQDPFNLQFILNDVKEGLYSQF